MVTSPLDSSMTPSQKGAWAESEILTAAVRMKLCVLRPMNEGRRYDLAIDIDTRILRVQCKWASRKGAILAVRTSTSRFTPGGYISTTYARHEIDAVAIFAPSVDRCYLMPVEEITGLTYVHLRLTPSRNNQELRIRWAEEYDFETQIRRLQEGARVTPRPVHVLPEDDTIESDLGL